MTRAGSDRKGSQPAEAKGDRIAKVLARAGLCSRREAERWIADGRVAINGTKLKTPAVTVAPGDQVTVDGKPIPDADRARLWRYHKPRGLVTTHRDERSRPTVFDNLPPGIPRVVSIGRLDVNSEGLLLLTNDGALARRLELPATGWVRRYRVRAYGMLDEKALARLADGITIDGVRYGSIKASVESRPGARPGKRSRESTNVWLSVSLTEGKNREVRRVLEHLGLQVSRLIRVAYGPFQLGLLEAGDADEVPRKVLREQLGEGTDK